MSNPKVFAMYLPQYHCIPENDEFWGKGFTDWVTVKKAKPLYKGHTQPRVPLNDNYYDLSQVDSVEWQAKLANEYGIYGFGVYHYWFNNEKNLLTRPAEILRDSKNGYVKYFFSWDNANWKRSWSNVKGNDWVVSADAELMSLLLQFHNPIAQSTNMIRAEFIKNNNIKFLEDYYYVVDYKFYMQILECGGKITNLDEVLLLYRFDNDSYSSKPETQKKQNIGARTVRIENLQRFFNEEEIEDILEKIDSYALHRDSIKSKDLYNLLLLMKERDVKNIISKKAYDEAIKLYVGEKSLINIFFTINNDYTQHLCVLLASILKNSTPLDDFHFYILNDGSLSEYNKSYIQSLKKVLIL